MTPSNGSCKCRVRSEDRNLVRCCESDRSLTLLACYCLGYYSSFNKTLIGNCLYSCSLKYYYRIKDPDQSCHKFNRQGQLCGRCKEGLGYPVYTYSSTCTNCTETAMGVLKYLAMAYLPLTVFYIIVIAFRVSVMSERLTAYVLVCQIVTMPAQVHYISTLSTREGPKQAINFAIAVLSIWNLDFFKSFYNPFCFHRKLISLDVISLDYLLALYPLLLIILTYAIVQIHDKCPTLSKVWMPVQKMCARVRQKWQIRKSLVDAFATFLLLSYMKILNASFYILQPTILRDLNGTVVSSDYLYFDGSVRLFHGGHTKYAILAILMSSIFNILPLLLLFLYPMRPFQSLLNRCDRSKFQLMHTFMDSFQGCYRLSPLDCRYFAAIHVLVRILNLVVFSVCLTRFYFLFAGMILILLSMLTAVTKPHRVKKQNTIDTILYLTIALGYLAAAGYALSPETFYNNVLITLIVVPCMLLVSYSFILLPYDPIIAPISNKIRRSYSRRRKWRPLEIDEDLFNSMSRDENVPLVKEVTAVHSYSNTYNGRQKPRNSAYNPIHASCN